MRDKIIFTAFFVLIMTSVSYAYDVSVYDFEWENSCLNTTTLFREANIYINGSLIPVNQTVTCYNGCLNSTLSCSPSSMDLNLILIALTFLILGMIVAGVKLHVIVGLPLLMISMFFTSYFLTMDIFTSPYTIWLATLVMLEVLTAIYVVYRYMQLGREE